MKIFTGKAEVPDCLERRVIRRGTCASVVGADKEEESRLGHDSAQDSYPDHIVRQCGKTIFVLVRVRPRCGVCQPSYFIKKMVRAANPVVFTDVGNGDMVDVVDETLTYLSYFVAGTVAAVSGRFCPCLNGS